MIVNYIPYRPICTKQMAWISYYKQINYATTRISRIVHDMHQFDYWSIYSGVYTVPWRGIKGFIGNWLINHFSFLVDVNSSIYLAYKKLVWSNNSVLLVNEIDGHFLNQYKTNDLGHYRLGTISMSWSNEHWPLTLAIKSWAVFWERRRS